MSTVVGTRRVTIGDASGAPSRRTSEGDLNQFNIWMRSQPWFQAWHQQRGLSPSGNGNRKLSRGEQSQLESLLAQNGVQLPGGMHIDAGGSANQKNRLGRNVAIGAAIGAGGYLAAPYLAGSIGALSGGGAAAAGTGAATGAATAGAAGATAGTGIGLSQILQAAITPTIGAASNYFSNRAASNSARDAAELESASMAEQLQFLREQEEQRRREHEATEARNYGIYTDERDYTRRLEAEKQARQEPYRRFHLANLGQLSQPMRNIRQRA